MDGRQTEDPNSPPCIPFFDGDNGGHTYQGVTAHEVRVLIYVDEGIYNGERTPEAGTYVDIDAPPQPPCPRTYSSRPPDPCDHILVRIARGYSTYFNDRYQTYDRRLHYFLYVSDADTPTDRQQDAQDNVADVDPFAVLDEAIFSGNNDAYVQAMSDQGVMTFATRAELDAGFLGDNAPLVWTWPGHIERKADLYASYVCDKVAPYPVSHTDDLLLEDGSPRVFGIYRTADPSRPDLQRFAEVTKQKLQECGVSWATERTFPHEGAVVDGRDGIGQDALETAAAFRLGGVTTVLWLGGVESGFSRAAGLTRYHPEIVLAGVAGIDGRTVGSYQNQEVWANAWGVQYALRDDGNVETMGYQALKESSPSMPNEDAASGIRYYRDHFMLAQAIQIAGPYLDPQAVEDGFFALPTTTT